MVTGSAITPPLEHVILTSIRDTPGPSESGADSVFVPASQLVVKSQVSTVGPKVQVMDAGIPFSLALNVILLSRSANDGTFLGISTRPADVIFGAAA